VDSDRDLHEASAHVANGSIGRAVELLLKVAVVQSLEIAALKAHHSPCIHQSEPEHDTG
jgi:hypothetical protein